MKFCGTGLTIIVLAMAFVSPALAQDDAASLGVRSGLLHGGLSDMSPPTRVGTAMALPELPATLGGDDCENGPSGPFPNVDFGDDGLALFEFDAGDPFNNDGLAVAVQLDGRILIGGQVGRNDGPNSDAVLIRLLPDGQPDPDFGDDGRLLFNIAPPGGFARITDVAVQADGRIAVTGFIDTVDFTFISGFFARLTPDGAFDASFDFNGVRILNLGDQQPLNGLSILPDGKLLGVGGLQPVNDELETCMLVVRLNADGSNDNSFGVGGSVCHFTDGDPPIALGFDLAIRPDGGMLVAGTATHGESTPENLDIAVLRLLPDGGVDTSFGDQGWAFVGFDQGGSFQDVARALAVDGQGRIILAGSAQTTPVTQVAVARLLPDGSLDSDFGVGGRRLISMIANNHASVALAASVLNDGRILLAGEGSTEAAPGFSPVGVAAVLRDDGGLDACFADEGLWLHDLSGDLIRSGFPSLAVAGDVVYFAGRAAVEKINGSVFAVAGFSLTGPVRHVDAASGDDQGGENNCRDADTPCLTIAHAIAVANPGDHVEVAVGDYTEQLTVDKSLTLTGAGPHLTRIQAHADPGQAGGRVFTVEDGNVTIADATIRHGVATGDTFPDDSGGGLLNLGAEVTLSNVILIENMAGRGGGMFNAAGAASLVLVQVTFRENQAGLGGGMYNDNSGTPLLSGTSFIGNSATGGSGGGMLNENVSPTLVNAIFSGNRASGNGGGMFNFGSSPSMINVSFGGNAADGTGGGIANVSGSHPGLRNVIMWNNQASGISTTGSASIANLSSTPAISYSLVANSGGSADWDDALGTDGGNNLDIDPAFAGAPDPDLTPTGIGDLRLLQGSPAIDAGDPDTDPDVFPVDGNGDPIDLDGRPRFFGSDIDMGAYEWQPLMDEIFVDRFEE